MRASTTWPLPRKRIIFSCSFGSKNRKIPNISRWVRLKKITRRKCGERRTQRPGENSLLLLLLFSYFKLFLIRKKTARKIIRMIDQRDRREGEPKKIGNSEFIRISDTMRNAPPESKSQKRIHLFILAENLSHQMNSIQFGGVSTVIQSDPSDAVKILFALCSMQQLLIGLQCN